MSKKETYTGFITKLASNDVFVFGSNQDGRHGAGSAKAAMQFGAKYGQGRGLMGQTYGIVTTDLRNKRRPNVPKEEIINEIAIMYGHADNNPDKRYLVAYSGISPYNLSGFSNREIADMFLAGAEGRSIPDNVFFEENFQRLLDDSTLIISV